MEEEQKSNSKGEESVTKETKKNEDFTRERIHIVRERGME